MSIQFKVQRNSNPVSAEERARVIAKPVFGQVRTDHQAVCVWEKDKGWVSADIIPYGPIQLDPAASVLHYAQEIFEGMKAYRFADGSIWGFRPYENAKRMRLSATRLALPEVPEDLFIESIKQLVAVDAAWVPDGADEKSLYLRPFQFASEAFLGVRPAMRVDYRVIASPAGPYFAGGVKPVAIWIALHAARTGRYGTGEAKCGGNYAASLAAQTEGIANGCSQVVFLDAATETHFEELGGMNFFVVFKDGRVATPELDGTVLRGVTRMSIIQLMRDRGITVDERKVTHDEVTQGIQSGAISELFACGTAAVITPISGFKSVNGNFPLQNTEPGKLTMSLREELTGIQFGRLQDKHGWMHRFV